MATATSEVYPLDASHLHEARTTNPKQAPIPRSSGRFESEGATDHMINVSWTSDHGWEAPKLIPYGPLSVMPSSSVVNYASSCFEGLRLYRGYDGRLRLLQPDYNCRRMLQSAARIMLPTFDPEELLKLIKKLCAIEAPKWLPKEMSGASLYVRPVLMGTDPTLGFGTPSSALLCIFLVYFPGPKLVAPPDGAIEKPNGASEQGSRMIVSSESEIRSYPKGHGTAKIGANYVPTLVAQARAKESGYDQVLYLFGTERQITEAGGSNVFFIWTTPSGELQMVTPPLDEDRLILAGNTRDFVLKIAREMLSGGIRHDGIQECRVLERKVTMSEVEEAAEQGRLEAAFITGTAWQIHSVSAIGSNGKDIHIPIGKVPHVSILKEKMLRIVYGKEDSDWAHVLDEQN